MRNAPDRFPNLPAAEVLALMVLEASCSAGAFDGHIGADDIGKLDPDGTEAPLPVTPPPPGDEDETLPPGQRKRQTIVVRPGQSIQEAIDSAEDGARIYVHAGVYRELSDPVNGLTITKAASS
jgi:hypothetical protein